MLRKLFVLSLFVSLLISQAMIYALRGQAAENTEMMDLAAMLPESDVLVTMDFNRTLSVAAPSLLGQDTVKIEHLKNLMRTVENQIGISPYEIRQIAAGLNIPKMDKPEEIFSGLEFTAIVRTEHPNTNMLDFWVKRIDAITAFRAVQAPSRKYMDEFRRFRDFKLAKATPEKVLEVSQKFQESLKKTNEINAALDKLPKLTTDAKAAANLRAKNKEVAASINKYLNILKADTERKSYRSISIKLLNRWNAVTLDDPQKTAKLAAILKESKDIYPAYKQKHENAEKIEGLINLIDSLGDNSSTPQENLNDQINSELDKDISALAALPATKAKKTVELDAIANSLSDSNSILSNNLETLTSTTDTETESVGNSEPEKKPDESFYDLFNRAKREENINGKKMIVIETRKLDAPSTGEKSGNGEKPAEDQPKKSDFPNIAVGFLDEKTMVIGLENTVTPFLKRDANYKNQKAVDMLNSAQNSLFAFGISADAMRKITAATTKDGKKDSDSPSIGSSLYSRFTKDISIYGSVNYDDKTGATNDISMSLGFLKEHVEDLIVPPTAAASESNGDSTFEIAGYQVGKDIFYDLFNSLQEMQATVSFKFEKKKIAELVRSTPRIIEKIIPRNAEPKTVVGKKMNKPKRLESVQDLLTAPQLYVELAGLLSGKN